MLHIDVSLAFALKKYQIHSVCNHHVLDDCDCMSLIYEIINGWLYSYTFMTFYSFILCGSMIIEKSNMHTWNCASEAVNK